MNYLKLPKASQVKIYDLEKIVNSQRKMSTSEKIERLQIMRRALIAKLKAI